MPQGGCGPYNKQPPMYRTLTILACAGCLAIMGCSVPRDVEVEVVKDRLPPTWKLDELSAAALDPSDTAAETRVLIWDIREDERPLYVEGAIAWLDTWALTSGVRDKELAESWINFVLQKKIGEQLSQRTGFGNTVAPFPSAGENDKLVWLEFVEDPTKRADLWNEIKAAP